jgi:hypothetical protein
MYSVPRANRQERQTEDDGYGYGNNVVESAHFAFSYHAAPCDDLTLFVARRAQRNREGVSRRTIPDTRPNTERVGLRTPKVDRSPAVTKARKSLRAGSRFAATGSAYAAVAARESAPSGELAS